MISKILNTWKESDPILKLVARIYVCAILIILSFPFIFTRVSFLGINFNNTGQIGDTIGGILGPFIAILAATLTFFAFWVQYRANQIQINNFNSQSKDIQIERFENRWFRLIELHRANSSQITIRGHDSKSAIGKEAFEYLFEELERTNRRLFHFYKKSENSFDVETRRGLFQIAYIIFFIGLRVNDTNNYYLKNMLKLYSNADDIEPMIAYFKKVQEQDINDEKDPSTYTELEKKKYVFYQHFEGHSDKLGHYFRHLFQMFKFLSSMPEELIPTETKYSYAKTLRAQLSNYEQLLLYYNSISPFGRAWLDEGYIIVYKLIKNIPLSLANFGVKPEEQFEKAITEMRAKGEELFEVFEITNQNYFKVDSVK